MPMTTSIRQISMIVIAKRDLLLSNNQMIWTSTVTTTDHYSKAKESISSTQNRALSLQSVQIVHTKRALRNLGPVKKSRLDQPTNIQMCKITHSHSSSLILQPKTSMKWVRRRSILIEYTTTRTWRPQSNQLRWTLNKLTQFWGMNLQILPIELDKQMVILALMIRSSKLNALMEHTTSVILPITS